MNKRTAILLIAGLIFGIVFAGQAEAKAAVKQNVTPLNHAVAPLSVSISFHSSTLDENPLPWIQDIIISNPLPEVTLGDIWMPPSNSQRQNHGVTRTGHGSTLVGRTHNSKFIQLQPSKSAITVSLSGNLALLSPHGLILRL
ncbi:MAG: hypothetical protein ABIH70_07010 [Chloroflexota bacterium]